MFALLASVYALLLPSTWKRPATSEYVVQPLNFTTEAPEPGGPFDYS